MKQITQFFFEAESPTLRTISAISTSFEVVTSFSFLKSRHLRGADRPLLCRILGYQPTTSTVHKIISSAKFAKDWSFLWRVLLPGQGLQMKV